MLTDGYETPGTTATIAEAVNIYRRLRQRGQSSVLARLSVEARYGELPFQQRRQVSKALRDLERLTA